MADEHRSIVWVDINGATRQTILHSSGSAASVEAALSSFSNAGVLLDWSGATVTGTPVPVAAAYQTVSDAAVLVFVDGAGLEAYVTLPAPQSSIFMADQQTVDPTAIAALITACVGTIATQSGAAVVAYVGGMRRKATREYQ